MQPRVDSRVETPCVLFIRSGLYLTLDHVRMAIRRSLLLALFMLLSLMPDAVRPTPSHAEPETHTIFLPLVQKPPPAPTIRVFHAQAQTFEVPYGYGLYFDYEIRNLDVDGRQGDFVTTQYSPDNGETWITEEAQRSLEYDWDNIHGDIACGLAEHNLQSSHLYLLRAVLTWHDAAGTHQTFAEPKPAWTEAYDCDDLDADGVSEALEQALAERFFPHLWVRWENSDRRQSYAFLEGPGRVIPYTVYPHRGIGEEGYCDKEMQCMQIRYGLAYQWDCGDDPKDGCNGINKHLGDNEFYAVLVAREAPDGSWGTPWEQAQNDPSAWRQVLSETFGHHNTPTDSSACHYYTTPRTTPATLFVAEGKHATYHSVADCDRGGLLGSDYCVNEAHGGIDLSLDLTPSELQNVGHVFEHFLFDTTITDPSHPDQDSYDIWGGRDFGDASSYLNHFTEFFNWEHWWWYNEPQNHGCGDLCGCRDGD